MEICLVATNPCAAHCQLASKFLQEIKLGKFVNRINRMSFTAGYFTVCIFQHEKMENTFRRFGSLANYLLLDCFPGWGRVRPSGVPLDILASADLPTRECISELLLERNDPAALEQLLGLPHHQVSALRHYV